MAVIQRITDFIPNTLIESQEVDDEFNQLVNLLSGVSTNKDTLLKYNNATDPVLRVDQLGAGLIQQWLHNGTVRSSISALGRLVLPAGIGATPSTDTISNLGTYFSEPTQFATGANTTETDFASKTVAANTFAVTGDFMLGFANFTYANNANTKRVRLKIGTDILYDTTAAVLTNLDHNIFFLLFRAGAQLFCFNMSLFNAAAPIAAVINFAPSPNFGISNVLKFTAQNGAASAGDINQRGCVFIKGSL